MGRGREFSSYELDLLVKNFDLTIIELEELFLKHGYSRSRKSINRKLEKLREEGDIGMRSQNTVQRAYKQRNKRGKLASPSELDGGPSLRDGDSSFGSGFGEASWDDDSDN
jgi:hypothetical protein